MASKAIKAIDKQSIHRICSGQVVLSLATAAKELIENSLDAGATNIEVRLKEYGSQLIEVIDNGGGVEPENYQALTLKHHTSKLAEFNDLVEIETFGFRGEALSSLCALGELSVVTCTKAQDVGTKLEYDMNGMITTQTPASREVGTTVSIANIFTRLPVRHRQLQKNLKKEYAKLLQVIHAYCIISVGVKISCTNQIGKGGRQKVLATELNSDMRENFINLFGAKAAAQLLAFAPKEDCWPQFKVVGYISKVAAGNGRSSTDRQFFFINNRPCDLPKLSKTANDVYRQYNHQQSPVVVFNIVTGKDACDINVTPDKRTILLHYEVALLAHVQESLHAMFEPSRYTYQLNNGSLQGFVTVKQRDSELADGEETERIDSQTDDAPSQLTDAEKTENDTQPMAEGEPRKVAESSDSDWTFDQRPKEMGQEKVIPFEQNHASKMVKLGVDVEQNEKENEVVVGAGVVIMSAEKTRELASTPPRVRTGARGAAMEEECEGEADSGMGKPSSISPARRTQRRTAGHSTQRNKRKEFNVREFGRGAKEREEFGGEDEEIPVEHEHEHEHEDGNGCAHGCGGHGGGQGEGDDAGVFEEPTSHKKKKRRTVVYDDELKGQEEWPEVGGTVADLPFNLSGMRERQAAKKAAAQANETEGGSSRKGLRFRAKISPDSNQAAEAELARTFTKESFGQMKVHGQFNLGFIIASLGTDLFIIDQHATDEKYNFETLQKNTRVQSQKLIRPKPLELTAPQETTLLDNLEVFAKNGFEFHVDESKPAGRRVGLTTIPYSKSTVFGSEDVEELIFMLGDAPGSMCRPTRVTKMFAMRACRSSVMIGTALNKQEMCRLVKHMGELEQPWNCPHGRPTMRHLIDISRLAPVANL